MHTIKSNETKRIHTKLSLSISFSYFFSSYQKAQNNSSINTIFFFLKKKETYLLCHIKPHFQKTSSLKIIGRIRGRRCDWPCWGQHHKAIFFTRNGTIVGSRSSLDGVNGHYGVCNDGLAMAADYLVNNVSRELDRIAQNMYVSTHQPEDIKDDNKDIDGDNDGHMGLINFIADNLEDDNSGRGSAHDAASGVTIYWTNEVDAHLQVGLTMEEISANADVKYAEDVDNTPRQGGAIGAANNEEEDANHRQIGIGNCLLQQLPSIQIQKIRAGQYLSQVLAKVLEEVTRKDCRRPFL
ncbi:hypothetical protein RFI_21516 [Reticulomyxa filosa]|uniref:Uncharacterized protein n=1 Tax=Reticulomyxa filosa TaxID=46433 RepID=X6MPC3_RETFI|nr:hypothetical protein RFI_21516 [Reticulomyxa filosa]|eukprot:ETO15848.1 hypothetical protein RFI_21516 [Reticulomyxa filosa]